MDWLQLHLSAPSDRVEALEDALHACGAVAVSFGELGDRPVLEPAVGEMPLWDTVAVAALFPVDSPRDELQQALTEAFGAELPSEPRWEVLEDRPWEREWLQHFAPIRCGERLWVCPHGHALDAPGAVILRLDPGLAFGTGTHPTTALCLGWLDAHARAGEEVIDYGCGSGILGIAALLLGAGRVRAVDIDPQALLATRENAARNGIAEARLRVSAPEALSDAEPADLLLANILAGPLVALAPRFATLLRPGGVAVLSGVLEAQSPEVIHAASPWFSLEEVAESEGWCRIALRRNTAGADPAAA